MAYEFSKKSLERLEGVHPDLIRVAVRALSLSPLDFSITQGVRTLEQQKELYAQGRTKPGKKVTWTMKSKHLPQADGFSHAVDFGVHVDGELTWDEKFYLLVGPFFERGADELGVKVEWGGRWKKKDLPHIQLA
jgi:peptidoglycan L-alanyl-D-glutamate endopeptidase CwlK